MKLRMMRFWKVGVISFIFLLSLPFLNHFGYAIAEVEAATTTPTTYTNLGFLQNGIWYSKDPFFDGDAVRIYTAVFNSSEYDLVGKVEFYDNTKPIGQTDFSVTSGGKIRDVWVDFTATKGVHKFSAKIISAQISKVGTTGESITLSNTQTGTDTRTIDIDTDKDGIGNVKDLDDDGDGILDATEIKNGTDPLTVEEERPIRTEMATTSTANKIISDAKNLVGTNPSATAQKMFDFAFNTAKTVAGKINDFTDTSYQSIEVKKAELQKEIEQAKTAKTPEIATSTKQLMEMMPGGDVQPNNPDAMVGAGGFSLDSPLKTAYLFVLNVLGFLLSNKTLFYIFSIFVIYKVLSFFFGRISQKIAEPKGR